MATKTTTSTDTATASSNTSNNNNNNNKTSTLVPSQIKQPKGRDNNRRNRGRGRRGVGTKQKKSTAAGGENSKSNDDNNAGEQAIRNSSASKPAKSTAVEATAARPNETQKQQSTNNDTNKHKNNPNLKKDDTQKTKPKRKRRTKKNHTTKPQPTAWKKLLPKGEVDPISLDPLHEMKYPPFALAATEPYETLTFNNSTTPQNIKNWHLFDGRVLAYYMISQMQFIDPLNRRDLTLLELDHLDRYLKEHRLLPRGSRGDDVVSAYQSTAANSNSNSAGRAGQTERARSERLQREAALILDALFAQRSVGSAAANTSSSAVTANNQQSDQQQQSRSNFLVEFERQHRAEEERERNRRAARLPSAAASNASSSLDRQQQQQQQQHGIVVIDDDEHPELRGRVQQQQQQTTSGSFSASLSAGAAPFVPVYVEAFPSLHQSTAVTAEPSTLSSTSTSTTNQNHQRAQSSNKKPPSTSSSLGRISKMVQKTSPAVLARQRQARLDAQQRAAMSQLTFEEAQVRYEEQSMTNDDVINVNSAIPSCTSSINEAVAARIGTDTDIDTDDNHLLLLERNQRFANALGIVPSTVRRSISKNHGLSGWARPTNADFCNELSAANYPDSLIVDAKENLALILKIEKRWTAFLANDTNASFQCKPMEKLKRKLVHEYSDFWFLHTESFDPAPHRYVNCVKTAETKMPHPLLSAAVKSWRGPKKLELLAASGGGGGGGNEVVTAHVSVVPSTLSTAGSTADDDAQPDVIPIASLLDRMGDAHGDGAGTQTIILPKERPKLQLAPRTLPTELPLFVSDKEKREEARLLKRSKELETAKKNAEAQEKVARSNFNLFDAFDSDNDSDSDGSVWSESSAIYQSDNSGE